MVAALVLIRRFSNSYITILVSSNGSNSVSIMLLNKIAQLFAINAKLICMVAVFTFIFNRQDIGIYSNGSNGISILGVFLNEALQSIFINTNYIILIIQTATAYAVIYSNDSMTGFCSSNSIGIIFLNGLNEFIFVNSYGIIVITVIINHFGNIYITVAVSLCGSNGVSIICLNSFNELIFINSYGIIVVTVCINSFGNIHITFAVCLCGSNGVSIILLYKIT